MRRLKSCRLSGDPLAAKEQYSRLLKSAEFGDQAREEVEKIDMDQTETQAPKAMHLNRDPQSEAERLYIDALRFEQFKDRITALAKYRSLAELLKDREADRKYVNLARKKIKEIEESGGTKQDVISLVNDNLKRADDLATKGELLEAQNIWNSIVTLYGANRELEQQVTYARARLKGDKIERTIFGLPKAPAAKEGTKETGRKRRASEGETMSGEAVGRPMDILLVEDSLTAARMAIGALKKGPVPHRLTWLTDGQDASEFVYRRGRFARAPRPDSAGSHSSQEGRPRLFGRDQVRRGFSVRFRWSC